MFYIFNTTLTAAILLLAQSLVSTSYAVGTDSEGTLETSLPRHTTLQQSSTTSHSERLWAMAILADNAVQSTNSLEGLQDLHEFFRTRADSVGSQLAALSQEELALPEESQSASAGTQAAENASSFANNRRKRTYGNTLGEDLNAGASIAPEYTATDELAPPLKQSRLLDPPAGTPTADAVSATASQSEDLSILAEAAELRAQQYQQETREEILALLQDDGFILFQTATASRLQLGDEKYNISLARDQMLTRYPLLNNLINEGITGRQQYIVLDAVIKRGFRGYRSHIRR